MGEALSLYSMKYKFYTISEKAWDAMLEAISGAQKSILIVTPYFLPHRWLFAALHQAALRGVEVSVMVPKDTDHWAFTRINYLYILKLHKLGVRFYL